MSKILSNQVALSSLKWMIWSPLFSQLVHWHHPKHVGTQREAAEPKDKEEEEEEDSHPQGIRYWQDLSTPISI